MSGTVVLNPVIRALKDGHKTSSGFSRQSNISVVRGYDFDKDKGPFEWNESIVGTNSTTNYLSNEDSVELVCGQGSSDEVIRQTKMYHPYTAGQTQLYTLSGRIGSAKTDVYKRLGVYDDQNGIFLENFGNRSSGEQLAIVVRDYTSGSVSETRYTRTTDWDDPLDGTGDSEIDLNPSNQNTFLIDYHWSTGLIRVGLFHDGKIVYFHEIENANRNSTPFVSTPRLPIRYEIKNDASVSSNTTTVQSESALISQKSSFDRIGDSFTVHTDTTSPKDSVSTEFRPFVSVRPKQTFNGNDNRTPVAIANAQVGTEGMGVLFKLILNADLTGASWSSVDPDSVSEYDISATGYSGGTEIISGFSEMGEEARGTLSFDKKYYKKTLLNRGIDISNYDSITLAVRSPAGSNTVCHALLNIEEL